jgi:putative membrane protein
MIRQSLFATTIVLSVSGAFAQGDITPQQFVDRAAVSDMFDIESSRLALQRAQLPATRSFAERMVLDHSAGSARLSQVVAGSALTVPMALDAEHEKKLARLVAASPTEFDAAYIQAQQTGHKAAVEMFTNYAALGSEPALKAFASDMLPILRSHQNEVQVMK